MGEPTLPGNLDQDLPAKSGEEMGEREPLTPRAGPGTDEGNTPLPEKETYERERNEKRPHPGACSPR